VILWRGKMKRKKLKNRNFQTPLVKRSRQERFQRVRGLSSHPQVKQGYTSDEKCVDAARAVVNMNSGKEKTGKCV